MHADLKTPGTNMLVEALLSLRTQEECYALLEDLCTVREIHDLSQRLEVALLLDRGETYAGIVEKTGASTATIGRVNRALHYGAGGYEALFKRIARTEEA